MRRVRDTSRIVLPPASFAHERDKIARRWPAAVDYIQAHGLNEFFDGDLSDVGHHPARRDVQRRDARADADGPGRYLGQHAGPALRAECDLSAGGSGDRSFLYRQARGAGGRGRPARLHRAVHRRGHLREADLPTRLLGKRVLPMAGEYTVAVLEEGVRGFFSRGWPGG